MPPSTPGSMRLRRRMLAKVPRIITSWLPRRAPYELKSLRSTPCASSHFPAGLAAGMLPAGERARERLDPRRRHRHPREVGRVLHVGRVVLPGVAVALRDVERAPLLGA